MMNSQPLPPLPTPRDIEALLALVQLLADPDAAQRTIGDFQKAAAEAYAVIDRAAADRAAADAYRVDIEATIAQQKATHQAALDAASEDFRKAIAVKETELAAREKRSKELLAQAEADAALAAADRAEMQRRLRAMEGAA